MCRYSNSTCDRNTEANIRRQTMADHLRRLPWDIFATLTFKSWCGVECAFDSLRRFADSWPQETQGPIVWWAVAETSPSNPDSRVHLHVLFHGLGSIPEFRLIERWRRYGLVSEFQPYDSSRGPEFYMQKQLWSESSSSAADFCFSKNFLRWEQSVTDGLKFSSPPRS